MPISKIRKPHLPIGLNIWNTLYRADVPSKKWFRIVFREDQPSTKEQPEGMDSPSAIGTPHGPLSDARSSEGGFKRADGAATVPRAVDAVTFVES